MITSEKKVSARLELSPDGHGRLSSIYGELDMSVPPTPLLIQEKLSLLKLCDKGTRVEGVGKKQNNNLYYLWFSKKEVQEVLNQRKILIGE
jgi:hypothetical protein